MRVFFVPKWPIWVKFWTDTAQNVQFSSFPEKNVTFLHSLRLAFMQKIREIQYAVFEKMRKTFDFGHFWPFWLKMANFGQTRPKMSNFWVFLKKKSHFFTLPKTSIHAKNQRNPMCGFLEKRLRARQRDRETETRQYLMVRIRPVGVGPKTTFRLFIIFFLYRVVHKKWNRGELNFLWVHFLCLIFVLR